MPRCRSVVLIVLASLLALVVVRGAWAGPATDQLRVHVDQVLKVVSDPVLENPEKTQERREAIRKVANDIFDFTEITKRSLGRHWQARTPAEQAEMVQLMTDLLERTYISKIEKYSGGEKVGYIGESLDGDVAMVRTKIVTPERTEIPIDYRMYRRDDRWLTYDVFVEGVSLVANYRTQFNAIIQKSSYQELVKKMKEKQQEVPEPGAKRKVVPVSTIGGEEATPAPGRRQAP